MATDPHARCPCGSGRTYKNCCSPTAKKAIPHRANIPISAVQNTGQWTKYALPLFVGAGTFLAFFPALKNGFLAWDDVDNFVTNTEFRGLGLKQLTWMFTTYHMGPYQPLSWLSCAIDYKLCGMNPVGYHFTNVLLHSLNAVLFYFITRRILSLAFDTPATDNRLSFASALAALFFSIHPLRVESVAWATERRDVLSGFFFLLAGLSYLERWKKPENPAADRKWYWVTVLLYLLALLSKATALGMLWCLIALDIYPLKRLTIEPRRWLYKVNGPVWM